MPTTKQFITLRVPRAMADEVRRLADREAETQSTIIRRLLRVGLLENARVEQHSGAHQ